MKWADGQDKMMNENIKRLKDLGVHVMKSETSILLELLEEGVHAPDQVDQAITQLMTELKLSKQEKVLFECPQAVLGKLPRTKEQMKIVGERVMYTKDLSNPFKGLIPEHELWPTFSSESIAFLSEVMGRNVQDTESFLLSMKTELPEQVNKMYTVLVIDGEPAGVVLPHIEPDTDQEGRIFWIGMHPRFVGKGFGQMLHVLGLYRLQHVFKAKSYLGATQKENIPMRRIMTANGCRQMENPVVSLESRP